MINNKYKRFFFILLSLIIVLSDQITKYLININFKSLVNKEVLFFNIDYVKNYGAAFNLFSGNRIFLSILSSIITLVLIYIILNKNNLRDIDLYSYSFILGGSIGNGIDRIIKGYVIDFINLNFINFPIFNVADVFINIGLFIIIYCFIKYKR